MKKVAVIDKEGNLTEIKKVPNSRWKQNSTQIPVPDDCDLVPEKGFRWDEALQTFHQKKAKLESGPALTQRAIIEGFEAIAKHLELELPDSTLKLIELWKKQTLREEGKL